MFILNSTDPIARRAHWCRRMEYSQKLTEFKLDHFVRDHNHKNWGPDLLMHCTLSFYDRDAKNWSVEATCHINEVILSSSSCLFQLFLSDTFWNHIECNYMMRNLRTKRFKKVSRIPTIQSIYYSWLLSLFLFKIIVNKKGHEANKHHLGCYQGPWVIHYEYIHHTCDLLSKFGRAYVRTRGVLTDS